MFALYGFGLREVIVCSFVFLTCLFACFATLSRRKNLRLTVVVIQTLSLLVLLASLLNEDRMIATAHNIRTMFTQGISQPIGAERWSKRFEKSIEELSCTCSLLLLYVFLILLTIMLVVQVVANILNVFHSPACELHTLKTTGSAGPPTVAQHQSQF
ncbi:hypothetical protein M3Y99_01619700 [Aphelenchoides fujianensis]|nr:hypothetical protein M3Y99_01619700 [Aphelenchoides fujianensis]